MKRAVLFRPCRMIPLLGLLLAGAVPAAAQDAGTRTTLDGVYTEEQASRGESIFRQECAACHTPGEFSAPSFLRAWSGAPVVSLFEQVASLMPEDNPGSLSARQYVDVLAYFLRQSGLPAGAAELPADVGALGGIIIRPPAR